MKIRNILAILAAGSVFLSSCNAIFRDSPYDKLSENEIWGNEKLLDEYTAGWYRNMDNGFYILVSTTFKNLGEEFEPWFGDQITVGRRDWYQAGYGMLLTGSASQITSRSELVWQNQYEQIRSINKLLEHSDEIPTSVKNRLLGEAHFFRAWYFYKLLRRYGGVLLIDRTFDPLVNQERFPRASFEETVEFIANEAYKAAELLPVSYETRHTGRITKGAAYMLAGKTYFWAAGPKFQNSAKPFTGFPGDNSEKMRELAAKAYDEVFKLKTYALIPATGGNREETVAKYRNIFLTKNSQESILEVQHSDTGDFLYEFGHKLDRDAAPPSMTGTNCAYNPTQNHVDEYRMADGKTIEDSEEYDEDQPFENRDVRFYANILYDGAMWKGHKMDLHYTVVDGKQVPGVDLVAYGTSTTATPTRTGYYMAKFLRESQQIDTDENFASSQNYIFWRYAELLLDYAELDWYADRKPDALDKINQIRNRVGMPSLKSISLEDIMNERRVELAFEKTTYWDLLRLGIAEDVMCGEENPLYNIKIVENPSTGRRTVTHAVVNGRDNNTRFFAPHHYFWPISWSDIRYHKIEQNPGWQETI